MPIVIVLAAGRWEECDVIESWKHWKLRRKAFRTGPSTKRLYNLSDSWMLLIQTGLSSNRPRNKTDGHRHHEKLLKKDSN